MNPTLILPSVRLIVNRTVNRANKKSFFLGNRSSKGRKGGGPSRFFGTRTCLYIIYTLMYKYIIMYRLMLFNIFAYTTITDFYMGAFINHFGIAHCLNMFQCPQLPTHSMTNCNANGTEAQQTKTICGRNPRAWETAHAPKNQQIIQTH